MSSLPATIVLQRPGHPERGIRPTSWDLDKLGLQFDSPVYGDFPGGERIIQEG